MTNQHPITPLPELVEQWRKSGPADAAVNNAYERHIATQAARWGADQELNACCEWIYKLMDRGLEWSMDLREFRRPKPKPPSLKEQALEVLNEIESGKHGWLRIFDNLTTIRRALESLPE